jgi:potassium-transporting ATPase KdpC subunit
MRRQIPAAIRMVLALTILTGVIYPLVVTGIAHVAFSSRANGSLVSSSGHVVGSSLIGQSFTDEKGNPLPRYFQPRPSAAGQNGYDATASGGSNLGPSNPKLLALVAQRVADYRAFNGLPADAEVPIDAVTASGSGLDPAISLANALDQAPRVARARSLPLSRVVALINSHLQNRPWGFLGENTVNVLLLNLSLDEVKA